MEEVNTVLEKIEQKHIKEKRKSLLFAIIPIIVGATWLLFSYYQVRELDKLVMDLKNQCDTLKKQEKKLKKQVEILQKMERSISHFLEEIAKNPNFKIVEKNVNWPSTADYILNNTEGKRKEAILKAILLSHIQPKFKLGGKSLKDGLDSTTFVEYVLKQVGITIQANPNMLLSERLMDKFNQTNDPKPGDLIFYKGIQGNFCLFYLSEGLIGGHGIGVGALQKETAFIIMDTANINPFFKRMFKGYYRVNYEAFQ